MAINTKNVSERGRDVIATVLLLRHAERDEDVFINTRPVIESGRLTEKGKEDSRKLGAVLWLAFHDFDLMRGWGSQRLRTEETAEAIAEGFSKQKPKRAAMNYRLSPEYMIPESMENGKVLWDTFSTLKKGNNQIDLNSLGFDTENGKLIEKLIAAPVAAMIEHARHVARRSPSGSRKLSTYICHDVTIALFMHYAAEPGELERFGNPDIPLLGGLAIDIKIDRNGAESLHATFLGNDVRLSQDRLIELNDFYKLRIAARK